MRTPLAIRTGSKEGVRLTIGKFLTRSSDE